MGALNYNILLQQASYLLDIGRAAESVPLLRQASLLAPDQGEPHRQLMWAFLKLGNLLDAYRSVKEAIALEPENAWSHYAMADFHRSIVSREEALKAAMKAVRLAPEDPFILQMLGLTQIDGGLLIDARQTAERIRALAPRWSASQMLLGHIARMEGREEDAETYFRKALELDPSSSSIHHQAGISLRRLGRSDEALSRLHEAVRLDPMSVSARQNLNMHLSDHLWGPKWLMSACAALYVLALRRRYYQVWHPHSHIFLWILRWSPLLAGGAVLVPLSFISWRRIRLIHPDLRRIYRQRTWSFRKELGRRLSLALVLPLLAWLCGVWLFKSFNTNSVSTQVAGGIAFSSATVLVGYFITKKMKDLLENGPWRD